ncbi:MAG TPA: aromatic ring-hydroxylating dioxygenase subunit alpha [Stellaceae bacterium]|nr:aromatic ring-hydroxylating dioxygenase subunit alpha [Stellaceae bacterium]
MALPMFQPETYAATRQPLDRAAPLPHWCYHAPEWYAREVETIFRKEWLCVGRAEQVPRPGDFYTIRLVGEPLLVVRDTAMRVNVLSAVCRHRGAVIAEPVRQAHCEKFVCPYHSWTYGLDGTLLEIPGFPPPMQGVQNFDMAEFGLRRLRSDSWAGFVFVTFDPDAPALAEWLGELPDFLANYRVDEMRFTHRDIYDVECNWKVWLENAFENYHAPTIHQKHMTPGKPQNWTFESGDTFEAMYSQRSIVAFSGLRPLPGLTDKQASGLYHVWLRPSLQIILTSSYMKYRQYLPEGPEKLRLIENWSFPSGTIATAEFQETVGPAYYDKYSEVIREDLTIAPNVQRGMRSGAYRPGRYSLEEHITHKIANYVIDRVVGREGGRRVLGEAAE